MSDVNLKSKADIMYKNGMIYCMCTALNRDSPFCYHLFNTSDTFRNQALKFMQRLLVAYFIQILSLQRKGFVFCEVFVDTYLFSGIYLLSCS